MKLQIRYISEIVPIFNSGSYESYLEVDVLMTEKQVEQLINDICEYHGVDFVKNIIEAG